MRRPLFTKKRQNFKKLQPVHNIIRTLSKLGVCSRKQACEWVLAGRVQIKGRIIRDPGFKVHPAEMIFVDGKPAVKQKKIYLMLHKPSGYVTTRRDEKSRKTVYELLTDVKEWLFPVGRLDQDSEGLLLFTNDTAWGDQLTNPDSNMPRTYRVVVNGLPSGEDLKKIQNGMDIGCGEHSRPAEVKLLSSDNATATVEITLTEGKNREIRRMFDLLGKPVLRLTRTRFGPFRLDGLPLGRHKRIDTKWELF